MTITPVDWPSALKPVDFGFSLVEADVSGGQAIGGGEQFVASAGPRWEASMTLNLTNDAQVLALRALRVRLNGRVVPVKLPNFDGRRLSWPEQVNVDGDPTGVILHPGNTRNRILDGTDYADPEIPAASEIAATLHTNAALHATTATIAVTQGERLIPGQQFGIADRLYEIGTVEDFASDLVVAYIVTFLPPLRAAALAGAPVLFTRPYNLMRCLNLAQELRRLELLRFATLALEFSEYI